MEEDDDDDDDDYFFVSFRIAEWWWWWWCWCGTAGGCFTDDILYSSVNYHQEHVLRSITEPSRQHYDVAAACDAVMLRFHGVFNLYEVLICGYLHRLWHGPVYAINPRCAFRYFGRKFRKGDCLGLCTFVLIYSSMSILVLRCTTLNIFWKGRVCESMLCYLLVIIMAKLVIPRLNPVDLRYLFT